MGKTGAFHLANWVFKTPSAGWLGGGGRLGDSYRGYQIDISYQKNTLKWIKKCESDML